MGENSGNAAANNASSGVDTINPNGSEGPGLLEQVKTILSTVFVAVGIIAVIVIILGGVNYMMSQGDPGKVKKAKDTILYGVIGLVVAILAFAIVQFVLGALGANQTTS